MNHRNVCDQKTRIEAYLNLDFSIGKKVFRKIVMVVRLQVRLNVRGLQNTVFRCRRYATPKIRAILRFQNNGASQKRKHGWKWGFISKVDNRWPFTFKKMLMEKNPKLSPCCKYRIKRRSAGRKGYYCTKCGYACTEKTKISTSITLN